MADFTVGIGHLLDDSDSDHADEPGDKPNNVKITPPKEENENNNKESEKKQESEPELTGMALLQSMYKKEENRKRSKSQNSSHQRVKVKIKVGTTVDIYSASKKQWVEGTIKEFKGDTVCVLYGNGRKMKWLHKKSKNFRPKKTMVLNAANSANSDHSSAIAPSSTPPAAFSVISLEEAPAAFAMSQQVSYDIPEPEPEPEPEYYPVEDIQPAPPMQPAPPVPALPVQQRNMSPSMDHFEYDVTFTSSSLGLLLAALKDGFNCVIKKCLTDFTLKKVEIGSVVCAINGKNVYGLQYEQIRAMLKRNAAVPPLTVTFRSKMNGKGYKPDNNVNERGLLQIKVVGCMQLKHAATYVGIRVGKAHLTTKQLKKGNHHPEWMEVLSFKNFRVDHGKKALVSVYNTSSILKDKKVGSVEYPLPIKFNYMQKDSYELKNEKGKICGAIMLNCLVVPPR